MAVSLGRTQPLTGERFMSKVFLFFSVGITSFTNANKKDFGDEPFG